MENRYWNRNGAAQAHYDEMEAAGFEYTQATYRSMHSYYRYYNDGDLPVWPIWRSWSQKPASTAARLAPTSA